MFLRSVLVKVAYNHGITSRGKEAWMQFVVVKKSVH